MKKKIILGVIGFALLAFAGVMVWNYFQKSQEAAKALLAAQQQAQEPIQTETTIKIYFGNKGLSQNPVDCAAVFPIERVVPNDLIIRRRAVEEFLKGPAPGEAAAGYFSSLPTKEEIIAFRDKVKAETGQAPYEGEEIKIKSVKILAGTAYIVFSKEFKAYGGDLCRLDMIRAALRESLKQFPRIGGIMISLEGEEGNNINP